MSTGHKTTPTKIGLFLDPGEYPEDDFLHGRPTRARPPDRWVDIADMARRAEQVGFDAVLLPDHLLYRIFPHQPEGTWESFTLLAALAAITERIGLGNIVASTQFRNPALLAKMADTLDEISGGRFTLGIGAGWHTPELDAFGYPTDHPIGRFEEAAQIIRGLLTHGRMSFRGSYYSIQDCELRPRGPRPSGPPVMIGASGNSPRMQRLVAQYADIWNGSAWNQDGIDRITYYRTKRDQLDRACEAVGRDPVTLGRSLVELVNAQDRSAYAVAARGPAISGSPAAIAEALDRYADEGVQQVIVIPLPFSLAGIEAMAPVIAQLKGR